MKIKIAVLLIAFVIATWASNSIYLNKVSTSEKQLIAKEKEVEALSRQHDSIIIQYDNTIDMEKIKNTLEKQGMKVSRDVNYFKITENNQ